MRMYDVISDKRYGRKLSREQIEHFISGVTDGSIPDYQAAALLMAICINGMDAEETANLTMCMAESGDMVDLSEIPGIKVDKHSTGGVGDKTTLIVAPIVASCGVPVAKMSGRGLGHTGGTVDKLESIPGFKTTIARDDFIKLVKEHNIAVVGQSGNLAPADKKLYALRDVTATIAAVPLIASSIMSKKIAAGADAILLDVKTGSGAFIKNVDESIVLAKAMVKIGEHLGRKTVALITDMDTPLGHAIGNSAEVIEAVRTLQGKGPSDLHDVCVEIAANMLTLAKMGGIDMTRKLAEQAIQSGAAFEKLCEMVKAQGGDYSYIRNTEKFEKAKYQMDVCAPESGYIHSMDTEKCGIAAMVLGAGREKKDSVIDFSAAIMIHKKTGESVAAGECVATLMTNKKAALNEAEDIYQSALTIRENAPAKKPLIYARITE